MLILKIKFQKATLPFPCLVIRFYSAIYCPNVILHSLVQFGYSPNSF
jgi:hypothetical protein